MGIRDFQSFIERDSELCKVGLSSLDLVKTAWKLTKLQGQAPALAPNRLALVVDGENCLDRLYGGYYSDWSCGGEWNHMLEFLSVFFNTLQQANVHTAIFINGALEPDRFDDWVMEQLKTKQNVRNILKHLNKRGTPPPKVWWVPPTGVKSVLRLALRHLNVPVMSSMESHHQEVIGFLRENGYHGIVADNSEYCIFDPPRYFSARSLKLTLKMTVETREIIMDEVAKGLDLNPNRFSLMAALLGNHVLTEADLESFHHKLLPKLNEEKEDKSHAVIRAVVDYVRSLQTVDDVEALGTQIFGSNTDPRMKKLKDVVEYYNNGTEDGYKKFVPSRRKKREGIKLASDTVELEGESRQAYKNITAGKRKMKVMNEMQRDAAGGDAASETATKLENLSISCDPVEDSKEAVTAVAAGEVKASEEGKYPVKKNGNYLRSGNNAKPVIPQPHPEVLKTASDRHRQACMSPALYSLLTTGDIKLPQLLEDETHSELPAIHTIYKELRQKVYGIIFNHHHLTFTRNKYDDEVSSLKKKIKAIKVNQKKTSNELTLHNNEPRLESELLEEKLQDSIKKLELLEKNAPEIMQIKVREWLPYNNYTSPELVEPKNCQWSVPTVKRLWFGTNFDDKQRRLRAFLSCLNSDTPLMMNTNNVPQHLLLMCCVLRFIMTQKSVLRKPELDAFLVTACSPELMDVENLARLKLDLVTPRGVQLATLFMQGVEMALLANDACGAPVPFLMCCPWLFFDGKLFHSKLRRAVVAQNLMEMCNHDMQMVIKVEQMRKAILDGLVPEFSTAPYNSMANPHQPFGNFKSSPSPINSFMLSQNKLNMMMNQQHHQRQSSMNMQQQGGPGQSLMARGGGQLVVAGSVVGQWGANFATGGGGGGHHHSGRTGINNNNGGVGCGGNRGGGGGGGGIRNNNGTAATAVGGNNARWGAGGGGK